MSIAERIAQQYPSMSASVRAFADFVLDEPVTVARMSIHGSVRRVGVSVATATRFARAIGYANYPTFRSDLIGGFASALKPVKRVQERFSSQSPEEIIIASLHESIANLQETIARGCERHAEAVGMIRRARRILICGFDSGAALAQILATDLLQMRDNVTRIASGDGGLAFAGHLIRLGSADLLIVLSFPPHDSDAVRFASLAKGREIPVLGITDDYRTPLAAVAGLNLYSCTRSRFVSASNVTALALIEGLLAAVAHRIATSLHRAEAITQPASSGIEDLTAKVRTSLPVLQD